MSKRIYLAGPDVFYPDAMMRSQRLKELCADQGLEGVFPLDDGLNLEGLNKGEAAQAIYQANIKLIKSVDGVLVNMEPFRGPGMDGGSAFEMGYASALGLPIVGYSPNVLSYFDRTCAHYPDRKEGADGVFDPDGLLIEDFNQPDNLMMGCSLSGFAHSARDAINLLRDCVLGE
jgi:nucleoside 2-deoxyribosyltransferase